MEVPFPHRSGNSKDCQCLLFGTEGVRVAHDRIAPPAIGRAMAAAIPGARFVEIADASHGITLQKPERINALLLEHLKPLE